MGKKLLAAVLGGVSLFLWSFVAHDVLPMGKSGIKEIPNEQAVLTAMKANMPDQGLYSIPRTRPSRERNPAQQSAAMETRMHKVETGPSGLLPIIRHSISLLARRWPRSWEQTCCKSFWRWSCLARPRW